MVISSFWTLVVFLGGFVLLGVIIWAWKNNKTSAEQLRRTEQATRDLYQDPVDESSRNR